MTSTEAAVLQLCTHFCSKRAMPLKINPIHCEMRKAKAAHGARGGNPSDSLFSPFGECLDCAGPVPMPPTDAPVNVSPEPEQYTPKHVPRRWAAWNKNKEMKPYHCTVCGTENPDDFKWRQKSMCAKCVKERRRARYYDHERAGSTR